MNRRRMPIVASVALGSVLAIAGGAVAQDASPTPAPTPAPSFATTPGAVTLVGYSTPREAYAELIPLFQATPAGQGVTFDESYGASGDQSRNVRLDG